MAARAPRADRIFWLGATALLVGVILFSFHPLRIDFDGITVDAPLYWPKDPVAKYFPFLQPIAGWRLGILLTLAYFAGVAALGRLAFARLLDSSPVSEPVRYAAGFVPGYLGMIVVNRLLTIALPHSVAPWTIAVALVAMLFAHTFRRARARAGSVADDPPARRALVALGLAIAYLFMLALDLHYSRNTMVGNGDWSLLEFLRQSTTPVDPRAHLPFFEEHYDEGLFGYPLFFGGVFPGNGILVIWMLNALGKLTTWSLLYLLLAKHVSRAFAAAASAFCFMGTNLLAPQGYGLLFDSLNPFLFCLHIGRIIAPLLPFFTWSLLRSLARARGTLGRAERAAYLLLFAGMASISINGQLSAAATGVLFWLSSRPPRVRDKRFAAAAFAAGLALIWATYAMVGAYETAPWLGAVFLLAAAAACFVSALAHSGGERPPEEADAAAASSRRIAWLLGALGLSSLCLGNLLATGVRRALAQIFSWQWPLSPAFRRDSIHSLALHIGFNGCPVEHENAGYCLGAGYFAYYFGVIMLMALSAYFLFARAEEEDEDPAARRGSYWTACAVAAFAGGLLMKDFCFTGRAPVLWLLSRLLEAPYYSLVVLFFLAVGSRSRSRVSGLSRRWLLALAWAWCLLPMLVTGRLSQVWSNLLQLRELAGKS